MSEYKELSTQELKQWVDDEKDFVLLDVLSPESYAARHIPTAQNAPVGDPDFLEKVKTLLPDQEAPVVVYCSSTQCGASPRAASALTEAGYTNVYDYEEGLAGWQNAGHSFTGETTE